MPRFDVALRRLTQGRRPRPKPPPPTYDTLLSFGDALTKSSKGLTVTVTGSLDADEKFEFNGITNPGGTPTTMNLRISAADVCQVDFPSDYLGASCRYTGKDATQYTTTFTNGQVDLA